MQFTLRETKINGQTVIFARRTLFGTGASSLRTVWRQCVRLLNDADSVAILSSSLLDGAANVEPSRPSAHRKLDNKRTVFLSTVLTWQCFALKGQKNVILLCILCLGAMGESSLRSKHYLRKLRIVSRSPGGALALGYQSAAQTNQTQQWWSPDGHQQLVCGWFCGFVRR